MSAESYPVQPRTPLRLLDSETVGFEPPVFEQDARSTAMRLDAITEVFTAASIPTLIRYEYANRRPYFNAPFAEYSVAERSSTELGISVKALTNLIQELNVPYFMLHVEKGRLLLAPGLRTVLAEEHNWRKKYSGLDELVSADKMAATLHDVDAAYVHKTLARKSFKPQFDKDNPTEALYPKQLILWLRAEVILFPPNRTVGVVTPAKTKFEHYGVDVTLQPNGYNTEFVDTMLDKINSGRKLPDAPLGAYTINGMARYFDAPREVMQKVAAQLNLPVLRCNDPQGKRVRGVDMYTFSDTLEVARALVDFRIEQCAQLQQKVDAMSVTKFSDLNRADRRYVRALKLAVARMSYQQKKAMYRYDQIRLSQ